MSKNFLKEPVVVKDPPLQRKKRPSRIFKYVKKFLIMFGIFDRNQIVRIMPFILFCTTLIIVYIANSYYAERIIREIDHTKNDLKEKRAEYISTMSQLMYQSNQSEVARALEPLEIKENTKAPGKIFIAETKKK